MRLPTREEALHITENSEAFYVTERFVEGQKVEMYDYRLASLSDFVDNDAFELRGLTFVYNEDIQDWDRNILLNKFFNVGQTDFWLFDDLKDKKIARVQTKEDGSIISPVLFSNSITRMKSKMSFDSDQAVLAQKIYEADDDLKMFIGNCFIYKLTPVFELVGISNQIVVNYEKDELVLLQIRDESGRYLTRENMQNFIGDFDIKITQDFDNLTLDELLKEKETRTDDIEGWVVTFEDGQMAKIKTNKYIQKHSLIGPDAFRENLLVKTILDGNIDDVISALVEGHKKERIIEIESKVTRKFNHLVKEFIELRRKYFQDFKEVRKDFAIKHSKDELFSAVMKTLVDSFGDIEKTAEEQVKIYILSRTSGLNDAKKFLESI